jgi:hypothetical protein
MGTTNKFDCVSLLYSAIVASSFQADDFGIANEKFVEFQ